MIPFGVGVGNWNRKPHAKYGESIYYKGLMVACRKPVLFHQFFKLEGKKYTNQIQKPLYQIWKNQLSWKRRIKFPNAY